MPSWDELLGEFGEQPQQEKSIWLRAEQTKWLARVGALRGAPGAPRNVILYGSGWLQKPGVPAPYLMVMPEDINGIMTAINGMDCRAGLTLIVHTPGGVGAAAQTIMSYLHTKFDYIEVIVPTYAMSAGTMMALGADRLVMGRQSQLGPIDAQLQIGTGAMSAAAILEQFRRASREILKDQRTAHVWAPILSSLGPSLLQEARMALAYGESMVAAWMKERVFKGRNDADAKATEVAKHFNTAKFHKSHGKRIDRDEARNLGLVVDDLETNQDLQNSVLTAYHLMTIGFEVSGMTKCIVTAHGRGWIKNYVVGQPNVGRPPAAAIPPDLTAPAPAAPAAPAPPPQVP